MTQDNPYSHFVFSFLRMSALYVVETHRRRNSAFVFHLALHVLPLFLCGPQNVT
jgi:hypothetical protein